MVPPVPPLAPALDIRTVCTPAAKARALALAVMLPPLAAAPALVPLTLYVPWAKVTVPFNELNTSLPPLPSTTNRLKLTGATVTPPAPRLSRVTLPPSP